MGKLMGDVVQCGFHGLTFDACGKCINAHSTRYHWFQHYNTNTSDEAVRHKLNEGARGAFEEDRIILEAVDAGMNDKKPANLDLRLDIGSRKFRKKLNALIKAEKEEAIC